MAEQGIDRDRLERRRLAREVAFDERDFDAALARIVREGLAPDPEQAEELLREGC